MNEQALAKPDNQSGRTARGWLMVKSAWKVLKLDKELVLFPLTSMIVGFFILVSGLILTLVTSHDSIIYDSSTSTTSSGYLHWVIWGVTLLCVALVSTYTTAAVIGAALTRYRGGDPTVRSSLTTVRKNFASLTMFGIFNFGVGQILAALERRLPFMGKLLAFLAGAAWGIANFFSIAVIVDSDERMYPLTATKKSVGVIRKVWAEGVVSQFTYGLIFFGIVVLEALVLIPLTALSGSLIDGVVGGSLAVIFGFTLLVLLLGTILVSSTIDGIIKAALYYYATTGEAPEHFNSELMKQAFTAKKARKIFGKAATF